MAAAEGRAMQLGSELEAVKKERHALAHHVNDLSASLDKVMADLAGKGSQLEKVQGAKVGRRVGLVGAVRGGDQGL